MSTEEDAKANEEWHTEMRAEILGCKADADRALRDMREASDAFQAAVSSLEKLSATLQDFADCGEAQSQDVKEAVADAQSYLLRLERLAQSAELALAPIPRRMEARMFYFACYNSKSLLPSK
jgi:hypothetical protein